MLLRQSSEPPVRGDDSRKMLLFSAVAPLFFLHIFYVNVDSKLLRSIFLVSASPEEFKNVTFLLGAPSGTFSVFLANACFVRDTRSCVSLRKVGNYTRFRREGGLGSSVHARNLDIISHVSLRGWTLDPASRAVHTLGNWTSSACPYFWAVFDVYVA